MFPLFGIVATATTTTTALSAFSEGLVTSLAVYNVARGAGKTNINLKK